MRQACCEITDEGSAPAAQDDSFLIIKEENCHNNPVSLHRSA